MSGEEPITPAADRGGAFPTTQWSMVVHAGGGAGSGAHAALESLCRRYWYPLYVYVRRQGRTHHEAEDCTQEFLARLLAADGIARARPEFGRFRTFLLSALCNFMINEWQRTQAAKRGGGRTPVPLEAGDADTRYALEPADPALSPDQAFDRAWARGLIKDAVAALRSEYVGSARGALFDSLAPLLWGNETAASLAQHAAGLAMKEQAFTVALHRLRRRLGDRLRATVAETVADPDDIDAELRHLIAGITTG